MTVELAAKQVGVETDETVETEKLVGVEVGASTVRMVELVEVFAVAATLVVVESVERAAIAVVVELSEVGMPAVVDLLVAETERALADHQMVVHRQ